MFETAELGHKVDKATFDVEERELRLRLLVAQRALRTSDKQVIVIVSGVEGAGKSAVVNRLSEWLDARGVATQSFWDETDEERQRPHYWRYWRRMPARGSIGVMFGSWYTEPIIDRALGKLSKAKFDSEVQRITEFERLLTDDGAVVVKMWFHIDKKLQKKRIKAAKKAEKSYRGDTAKGSAKRTVGRASKRVRTSPMAAQFADSFEEFAKVSERAIRATDLGHSQWYVVDASDPNHRDLSAGKILAASLERALVGDIPPAATGEDTPVEATETPRVTVLDRVDVDARLNRSDYKKRLAAAQARLYELSWRANEQSKATVLVFEGWDAAGKGGAIRRVTGAMDARLYRVVPIAAPTDEERAQHYLWRFWRHLPADGRVLIYDRSWYGRVLVERVEAFAQTAAWRRAYREINAFEEQLVGHGIALCKFWIHISKDEQLRRFEERAEIPWKKHKITEEDWRNREQWDAYRHAVNDMVARTSTGAAPWTLVAGNDKKNARVAVIEAVCERIESNLRK